MCLKFKYLYFKSLFEMSDLVPVQPTPANQSAPVYQTPTYQQAASPSTSVPQSSLSFQSTPSSQPALGPQPSTTKPTSTTQPTLAPQPSPALQQSTTSYQAPATYQQSHSYQQPAVVSNQPIAVAMPMQQYNPKKNESMPAGLAMVFEVAETLKIVFLFYAIVGFFSGIIPGIVFGIGFLSLNHLDLCGLHFVVLHIL
ncbi:hypothetical protein WA171_002526 [Blastocystis sp. BT1]